MSFALALAVPVFGQTVDELLRSSTAKRNVRDFPGAIADCDRVIALDGRNAMAYVLRGEARRAAGDVENACLIYLKVAIIYLIAERV